MIHREFLFYRTEIFSVLSGVSLNIYEMYAENPRRRLSN